MSGSRGLELYASSPCLIYIINREEYTCLIKELHKKNRLSAKNMEKYLER